MAFNFEIFDGELPGLADALAASLPALGASRDLDLVGGPEPDLVGPFAAYASDSRAFLEQGGAERSGWRGLVLHDNTPIATLDVFQGTDEKPAFGFGGKEAAVAVAEALTAALTLESDEREFALRWLIIPEIYAEALWLVGPTILFIPTRMGAADPATIEILDEEAFRARVRTLVDRATARLGDLPPDQGPHRSGLL